MSISPSQPPPPPPKNNSSIIEVKNPPAPSKGVIHTDEEA